MLYSSQKLYRLPSICVVNVDRLVIRSSGEQWLGRVESDGGDGFGMIGEGFHFFPGAGVVDVNRLVERPSGEQWLGPVEGDGEDPTRVVGEGVDDGPGAGVVDADLARVLVPRSSGEREQ